MTPGKPTSRPPLRIGPEQLLVLTRIANSAALQIADAVDAEFASTEGDIFASRYTVVLSLLLDILVQPLADHAEEIASTINQCWTGVRSPLRIELRRVQ
jgi:hypothetical protein